MKIVFLAWGSLVWNPNGLKISGNWLEDGPQLPIEFARISNGKRLTLVIYPKAREVRTLWAYAARENLYESICELAKREGTSTRNIGFLSLSDEIKHSRFSDYILQNIRSWAQQKKIDAVIWTDLPSNFKKVRKRDITPSNIVEYLKSLNVSQSRDAEIYVRRAPKQIKTQLRSIIEKEFGWTFITFEETDWSELQKELKNRVIYKSDDKAYWVIVPDKPATFGHILLISWMSFQQQDIADKGLFSNKDHMRDIIRTIHDLVVEMKDCLTSTGEPNGKRCEKVYLISECETEDVPFHFHLIPRFEGEKKGHLFLFEKEMEEARWLVDEDHEDKKKDGHSRISKVEDILTSHKSLLQTNNWVKDNEKRENTVEKIRKWWNKHSIK